jgi:hypothetical protein
MRKIVGLNPRNLTKVGMWQVSKTKNAILSKAEKNPPSKLKLINLIIPFHFIPINLIKIYKPQDPLSELNSI